MRTWQRTTLGRTGLEVGRLGIASSYGVPAAAVEAAFERGVNYLYYGSMRRDPFTQALRNLGPKRDRIVFVVQSYSRIAALVGWSLDRALRKARTDYADVLLLGFWSKPIPPRILDAARTLRERGKIRHIAVSCHHRPQFPNFATNSDIGILHVRYNAVHPGAAQEVFPLLPANPPGIVTFTSTSWGQLLKPGNIPKGEKPPTATDCYRFAMSHRSVDVAMCGPSNAAEAATALEALELGPLSPDELNWMLRVGNAIHG
jgi:aryl-alcohol dehydrogenase-like predicted oxidoreductase